MLKKGYTISPYSDLKEFADEALREILARDSEIPLMSLTAED